MKQRSCPSFSLSLRVSALRSLLSSPPTLARRALPRLFMLQTENVAPGLTTTMASKGAVMSTGAGAQTVPNLRVKKLNPDAVLPKRGSAGAAGYDLARYVCERGGDEERGASLRARAGVFIVRQFSFERAPHQTRSPVPSFSQLRRRHRPPSRPRHRPHRPGLSRPARHLRPRRPALGTRRQALYRHRGRRRGRGLPRRGRRRPLQPRGGRL